MSANVIKKEEFERLFALDDSAEREARYSSDRARIQQLEEEIETVREASKEEIENAKVQARREAERDAENAHARATAALTSAAQQLGRLAATQLQVAEQEIVDIALAVSAKILRREIAHDDEYLLRLVKRCLAKLVHRAEVTIRVHPADYPKIAPAQDLLSQETGTGHEISVVADRRVGAGGCVVETPDFIVDGTIGAQIDTARKTIRGGDL